MQSLNFDDGFDDVKDETLCPACKFVQDDDDEFLCWSCGFPLDREQVEIDEADASGERTAQTNPLRAAIVEERLMNHRSFDDGNDYENDFVECPRCETMCHVDEAQCGKCNKVLLLTTEDAEREYYSEMQDAYTDERYAELTGIKPNEDDLPY